MQEKRILQLALPFFLAALMSSAALYYCSPAGDDKNPGTPEAPWASLAKANTSVVPGDTVVLLPGIYAGVLDPARSGTADAPITYRSATRHAAVLRGPEKGGGSVISLKERSHILIQDFAVDPEQRSTWFFVDECRSLSISGCRMHRGRSTAHVRRSEQVKLLDNVFSKDHVGGNMVELRRSSRVLIEGNSFTRVGHSPLQITTCHHVVVRANCFRNDWGRNYEFWASGRLLVEGNLVTQARDSAYSADSRAKNLYIDSIYRFNRVFGNLHTPLNSGPYMPLGARPTSHFREPFRLLNSRIYNNVITENLGHGWEFGGVNVSLNLFANNILYRNDFAASGVQLYVSDRISGDNRYLNNLIGAAEKDARTIQRGGEHWTAEEANEKTRTLQNFWTEFGDNIAGVPDFADGGNNDFRLNSGSPCVDAGRPLALAMGAGNAKILPVTDGIPFYDGFGIDGERGDWIAIGNSDQLARIERIELRYTQAALLHLDREVVWKDGDPVSLPWAGGAPDIGFCEQNLKHPTKVIAKAVPAVPSPGQPVHFTLDTFGKKLRSISWNFGDGAIAGTASAEHVFPKVGQHGVVVRANFENGESGIDMVFVNVHVPRPSGAPLVEADFEKETRNDKWGYQFKFYRNRLTGYQHLKREEGKGMCMRLFCDPKKANRVAGIVAPGIWNIDDYPLVRFAYRIPPGTPVGLCVEPFVTPGIPRRILLGGTANRSTKDGRVGKDTNSVVLIDDDKWHTATVDVRDVRQAVADLQFLRLFQFHTQWGNDNDYEFRFDDFYILSATEK